MILTAEQVNSFFHHHHFIPVCKGYADTWVKENAPGWDFNTLTQRLLREHADKLVHWPNGEGHHPPYRCAPGVTEIDVGEFPGNWRERWAKGDFSWMKAGVDFE